MATIEVEPLHALNDIPWHIKVINLQPNRKYTIVSSCKPEIDASTFIAYAHYVSDASGIIDVDDMMSLGGTYTGVEPMGLMWSLTADKSTQNFDIYSPQYSDKVFVKKNVLAPVEVTIAVCEGHEKFEEVNDLQSTRFLARKIVERQYMSPQCVRFPVREGRLRGSLYVPSGKGPYRAILDIYGGGGGLQEIRASLLASHNYVTFAIAYYSYDDLPEPSKCVELEYFLEAIDFLLTLPNVQKSGVGVLSISYGGSLAMHIATFCPKVLAVVNICGPSCIIGYPKITYKKEQISFAFDASKMRVEDKGLVCFDGNPVIEERCVHIEKAVNCRFLFIYGECDKTVSPSHGVLLHSRCPNRSKLIIYPEAGHIIDPPYNPLNEGRWLKLLNSALAYGGTVRGHAKAQEASWKEILQFFDTYLICSSRM